MNSKEYDSEMEYQSDSLTGLYNRNGFYRAVRKVINDNPGVTFCIVCSNIRDFKALNELMGTETGDVVLQTIADTYLDLKISRCVFGRLHSDNFAACIPKDALEVSFFEKHFHSSIRKNDIRYEYIQNFGIYEVTEADVSIDTMYNHAKEAMDTIRNGYLDSYAFYTDEIGRKIVREQKLMSEMQEALAEKQFEIYYQPIYDIYSEKTITAEALTRWPHLSEGMISPAEFIPLFEKHGFILELDLYVLEQTCSLIAKRMMEEKLVTPISVNLSRIDFYKKSLCTKLTQIVDFYQIPHKYIRFEVTESAYANNEMQMLQIVSELKEEGFIILMDDFGSGYSSFNILKDIPVDVLKIDLRFLEDSKSQKKSENIITAIIRMAKWLELRVVAEGVETREQVSFLRKAGCDKAQGFYYSKPLPCQKYEELLDSDEAGIYGEYQEKLEQVNFDYIWDAMKDVNVLFDGLIGGMGLYELKDGQLRISRVNEGYYDVMGEEYREVFQYAEVPIELVYPSDHTILVDACNRATRSDKIVKVQLWRKKADGTPVRVEMRIRHLHSMENRSSFYFAIRDMSVEGAVEEHLRDLDSESKSQDVFTIRRILETMEIERNIFDIVRLVDPVAGKEYVAEDGRISVTNHDCFAVWNKKVPCRNCSSVRALHEKGRSVKIEFLNQDTYFIISKYVCVEGMDMVLELVANVSDNLLLEAKEEHHLISQITKYNLALYTDPLSGISNRRCFDEQSELLIRKACREKQLVSMAIIDIDKFKDINDTYGHLIGDVVIKKVASLLKKKCRSSSEDIVARFGGDEFIMAAAGITEADIERRMNLLLKEAAQIAYNGMPLPVSICIGAATRRAEGQLSVNEMIELADKALYEAKNKGRGYFMYDVSKEV